MPRRKALPLEKQTIRFYEGDIQTIADHYPQLGYNLAIRELVHNLAKRLREGTNQKLKTTMDLSHVTIPDDILSSANGDIDGVDEPEPVFEP